MPYQGPGDMPKDQTVMNWQQSNYMGDSGIHSGAQTQVPSLSGKEEEDMDLFDLDQVGELTGPTKECFNNI